ncbi:hypothetical protein [Aureivirga sp. CE67]|uniref:hypothetical protein n=1 Tax=Aureivirga sp. CE67 TaxID=1788983 RepID=UPI0018CB14D3|nr:hypothetical protein [Aureivirga sp. CE67]
MKKGVPRTDLVSEGLDKSRGLLISEYFYKILISYGVENLFKIRKVKLFDDNKAVFDYFYCNLDKAELEIDYNLTLWAVKNILTKDIKKVTIKNKAAFTDLKLDLRALEKIVIQSPLFLINNLNMNDIISYNNRFYLSEKFFLYLKEKQVSGIDYNFTSIYLSPPQMAQE